MTLRERCVKAGAEAMGSSDSWRWWAPRHLERLFDVWEPMIRAELAEKLATRYADAHSAYRESCEPYHDGLSDAYDIAERIVKREMDA